MTFKNLTYSLITFNLQQQTNESNKSQLFDSIIVTIIVACIAGIVSFVTIIGNVLTISAFFIDKSLRTYSNYFILNLSIADLFIGILIAPYIPFLLNNYRWDLGKNIIKFLYFRKRIANFNNFRKSCLCDLASFRLCSR